MRDFEIVTLGGFRAAVCAVSLTMAAGSGRAATLTSVPMQGGMLMPVVAYHADSDSVTVDLSGINETAQLTPLLVSNPIDSFAPGDPWFNDLDPKQLGLAFSRRYGFDMDPDTDLLPADRQLWIRGDTNSPNLAFYNYSSSPAQWAPIFGTGGSSNAIYWSGLMWHIGVTAPPGTNNYSATFKVYVVDTSTGQEVPGSNSGPFVLNWTSVPDGRPQLHIGTDDPNGVIITWPASATNWTLVSSANLTSSNWTPVTNVPVALNEQSAVYFEPGAPSQFFRLRRNP